MCIGRKDSQTLLSDRERENELKKKSTYIKIQCSKNILFNYIHIFLYGFCCWTHVIQNEILPFHVIELDNIVVGTIECLEILLNHDEQFAILCLAFFGNE